GTRKAEHQGERRSANDPSLLFRVPHSAFRDWFFGRMSIVVVLHEPQDLVNIAHVVRALKNFGFRDLRLVSPREYDPYRVEGIAHQTQDVLARVARFDRLEDALLDCVHAVGFTARGRTAKRNLQRPRAAASSGRSRRRAARARRRRWTTWSGCSRMPRRRSAPSISSRRVRSRV